MESQIVKINEIQSLGKNYYEVLNYLKFKILEDSRGKYIFI